MVREFDDEPGESAQESEKKKRGDPSALPFGAGTESLETEAVNWDAGSSPLGTESLDTEAVNWDAGSSPLGTASLDTEAVNWDEGAAPLGTASLDTEAVNWDAGSSPAGTESLDTEPVSSGLGPSALPPAGTESLDTEQMGSGFPAAPGTSASREREQVPDLDDPFASIGTTEHVSEEELQLLATGGSHSIEEIPMASQTPGHSAGDPFTSSLPTQQIEDVPDDTELVPPSSAAKSSLDDEVEEVLVLLPESDSTQLNSTLESETVADEYRGDFSQVANAGLRSVNPHSDGAEDGLYGEEEDFEGGYESADENVGVIDEIAALASSLDEDILSAEDAPDVEVARRYEPELPADEFDAEVGYDDFDAPRRKSRTGRVLTLLTLAAMVALGVVFYPSLIEKFRKPSDSSTAVANASNTGTDPGPGTVDPLETPPDGGTDGTDAGIDPVEDPGTSPADSTAMAIRQSVAISMEHGLRWKD